MLPFYRLVYLNLRRLLIQPISQQEMNELYIGDEFVLSMRHAQLLMMIFFSLMYSSGIPLLWPLGAFSAGFAYFVDKMYFVKICRTPPQVSLIFVFNVLGHMSKYVNLHTSQI